MNLLWAFNFAQDDSGTGGMEIDAYQKVCIAICLYGSRLFITPLARR